MLEISKKYVKSIFSSNLDEKVVLEAFKKLSLALENKDFRTSVLSPSISKDKKELLVLSILEDEKLTNLVKLLVEKNRIEAVNTITKELDRQISINSKNYNGFISSINEVSNDKIEEISSILSKKFDATINLDYKKNEYNGVLVDIEYLGVEIGFSWDRLEQSLQEHILKAI